jgi:hypothetical protein
VCPAEVYINYSLSDTAAALLRGLSPAAVSQSALLARFLSGPYCALVPPAEQNRLSLPRPTIANNAAFIQLLPISARCIGGMVVPVPVDLLRPLSSLADLCALFGKWRQQAETQGGAAPPDIPATPPSALGVVTGRKLDEALLPSHTAVPLPVRAHILRAVLDCAFALTMQPIVGGPGAKQQFIHDWVGSVQLDAQLKAGVLDFAEVAGFTECVQLLTGQNSFAREQ